MAKIKTKATGSTKRAPREQADNKSPRHERPSTMVKSEAPSGPSPRKRAAKSSPAAGATEPQPAQPTRITKTDLVLTKLRSTEGATVADLMEATGWQPHLVRGFLSAVVRKKLGLALVSEVGKDGAPLLIEDRAAGQDAYRHRRVGSWRNWREGNRRRAR